MGNNNPILSLGKDVLLYVPGRLFPALFGFVGLSVYTRIFSPSEYGEYSLVMAVIGTIGLFAYAWIIQSNLRFFSDYKDNDLDTFISTSFFVLIISLFFSAIALLILAKFSTNSIIPIKYFILSIGVLISTSFFEILINVLRADRNPKYVSIFLILSSILSLSVSLFLIYFSNIRISAIFIGSILVNSLLCIFLSLKFNIPKRIKFRSFSSRTCRDFVNYGIPLLITMILSSILFLTDRYLIALFKGNGAVGIYSAAYNLGAYPMSIISSILIFAAFPIIIDTWNQSGKETTKILIEKISRYYLLVAFPSLAGTALLSEEFIQFLGSDYLVGHKILPLSFFGSTTLGLCVFVNKGLELTKNTKVSAILVGTSGIFNVILDLLFIPKYSYFGAGMATAVAYFIYFLLSVFVSKKYLAWKIYFNSTINIIASSAIMSVIIILFKRNLGESFSSLVFLILLGIIVYFMSLIFFREIKDEILFIRDFINKFLHDYNR